MLKGVIKIFLKKNWKFIVGLLVAVISILIICIYKLSITKEDLSNIELIGFVASSVVVTSIVIWLSLYIYKKKDITQEKIFLYTIPIICIMFMIFMPMYKSHDEHPQWHRIYEISTGNLTTNVNENGDVYSILPKSVVIPDWEFMNYTEVINQLDDRIDNNDTTNDVYIITATIYSPLQYAHEALAIAIAKIFIKIPIVLAYIGRFANIIVCLLLMYFAIKKMPFGKNIILCIAYIPILIEGISSMSGDGITFAISLFFLPYILNLTFNNKIEKIQLKDKIVLLVTSIFVASCKIVYLPFIGLMLLLPKEKLGGKKEKIKLVAIVWGVAVLISLIWLAYSGRYLGGLSGLAGSAPSVQIMKFIFNPFDFVQAFLYNLEINGGKYLTEMFGSAIGWFDFVRLVSIAPYTLFVTYIITVLFDNSIKNKFNLFQKVILTLVILAVVGLIFLSLYIQWTKPDSQGIDGIQGRYFIPILPAAGLLIGSIVKNRSEYKEINMAKGISIIGLVIHLQLMLTIYICNI